MTHLSAFEPHCSVLYIVSSNVIAGEIMCEHKFSKKEKRQTTKSMNLSEQETRKQSEEENKV